MPKANRPDRPLKVVKSTPKVNKHVTTYERTTPRKRTKRAPKRKGYNAKKYTGMITGIADRMVEYLKTVRDDR
jgi:hypothetical protein